MKDKQWKLQELLLNNEELKWLKMVADYCKYPELERKFNSIIKYRELINKNK